MKMKKLTNKGSAEEDVPRRTMEAKSETTRALHSLAERINYRSVLVTRRRHSANVGVAMAIIGLLLTILERELEMYGIFPTSSDPFSLTIGIIVTVTTIALVCALCVYYKYDLDMKCLDGNSDSWTDEVDVMLLLKFSMEFLFCVLQPIPGIKFNMFEMQIYEPDCINKDPPTTLPPTTTAAASPGSSTKSIPETAGLLWMHKIVRSKASNYCETVYFTDDMLCVFMFCRVYLVCRCLTMNSHLFNSAFSRSLGTLNKVQFNFTFVVKVAMTRAPLMSVLSFMLFVILATSWSTKQCELEVNSPYLVDYIWMSAVTFLTVGYGDIVTRTQCGRAIMLITGTFGAILIALFVTVLNVMLELSNFERPLLEFITKADLRKSRRHLAADVIRNAYMAHKSKRLNRPLRHWWNRRKLTRSLKKLRRVKDLSKKSYADFGPSLFEVSNKLEYERQEFQNHLSSLGAVVAFQHRLLTQLYQDRFGSVPASQSIQHDVNFLMGSREFESESRDNSPTGHHGDHQHHGHHHHHHHHHGHGHGHHPHRVHHSRSMELLSQHQPILTIQAPLYEGRTSRGQTPRSTRSLTPDASPSPRGPPTALLNPRPIPNRSPPRSVEFDSVKQPHQQQPQHRAGPVTFDNLLYLPSGSEERELKPNNNRPPAVQNRTARHNPGV